MNSLAASHGPIPALVVSVDGRLEDVLLRSDARRADAVQPVLEVTCEQLEIGVPDYCGVAGERTRAISAHIVPAANEPAAEKVIPSVANVIA